MSSKAPPLIEISSTAPSLRRSRLILWWNVTVWRATGVNTGESSVKLPSIGRSGANAAFGAVSEYEAVVVKSLPPVVVDVVQPSGNDGTGASSKFSPGGNVPVSPLVTLSDAFAGAA